MKKANKILLLIFSITIVILTSCGSEASRQQSTLEQADFPCIVTKVEAKDTAKNQTAGCYSITVKRVNGMTWDFTSNVIYNIGDTLTIGIDTSHAFEKVMRMTEESIEAFKASKDSVKVATDSLAKQDSIEQN